MSAPIGTRRQKRQRTAIIARNEPTASTPSTARGRSGSGPSRASRTKPTPEGASAPSIGPPTPSMNATGLSTRNGRLGKSARRHCASTKRRQKKEGGDTAGGRGGGPSTAGGGGGSAPAPPKRPTRS